MYRLLLLLFTYSSNSIPNCQQTRRYLPKEKFQLSTYDEICHNYGKVSVSYNLDFETHPSLSLGLENMKISVSVLNSKKKYLQS